MVPDNFVLTHEIIESNYDRSEQYGGRVRPSRSGTPSTLRQLRRA
jgi:hypothetical protein